MQAEKLTNPRPAPAHPGTARPGSPEAASEDGLRSGAAIRWLLFVGALVVGVSVVRLVAAQWGSLALPVQFTALAAGNLGLYALGHLARHRLHLRVAGSALLALFATLTPVLAWGAGRQDLASEPMGALAAFGGLAACWLALRRWMAESFDYRGPVLPMTVGFYLFALPATPWLASLGGLEAPIPSLLIAFFGGLMLILACRHVNRFFFHRDRRDGQDRPLSYLPFALLTVLYAASVLTLGPNAMGLALLALFVAIALFDAGEEYVLAVERASGQQPEAWPRRSKGLLTLGFVGLAMALGLATTALEQIGAPSDPSAWVFELVFALGGLRLAAWALRHRSAVAHGFALLLLGVAAHGIYMIWPGAFERFQTLVDLAFPAATGWSSVFVMVALHEAVLALVLAVGAVLLRRLLTRPMSLVHGLAFFGVALLALVVSTVTAPSLAVVGLVITVASALATFGLRSALPVLLGWLGVVGVSLATFSWDTELGVMATGVMATNLGLTALAWIVLRRFSVSRTTARGVMAGSIAVSLGLLPLGLALLGSPDQVAWLGVAGLLAAGSLALAAQALRHGMLGVLASLGGFAAAHLAAAHLEVAHTGADGDAMLVPFALVALVSGLVGWIGIRRITAATGNPHDDAGYPHDEDSTFLAPFWALFGAASGAGLLWATTGLVAGSPVWVLLPLPILALATLDLCLRAQDPKEHAGWIGWANFVLATTPVATVFLACRSLDIDPSAFTAGDPTAWLALFTAGSGLLRLLTTRPRFTYIVERIYGRENSERGPMDLLHDAADWLWRATTVLAVLAGLAFVGPFAAALVIGHLVVALRVGRASTRLAEPTPGIDMPPAEGWGLVAILQLALLSQGPGFLPALLFQGAWSAAPILAFGALTWLVLAFDLRPRDAATPSWIRDTAWVLEIAAAFVLMVGLAAGTNSGDDLPTLASTSIALLFAVRHAWKGLGREAQNQARHGWLAQGWIAITVFQASALTWLAFSDTAFAFGLVGLSLALRWLRDALEARGHGELGATLAPTSILVAAWGGLMPLTAGAGSPWMGLLPTFLASLSFALAAHASLRPSDDPAPGAPADTAAPGTAFAIRRHPDTGWASALAAALYFVVGATASVHRLSAAGPELYLLGPGLALLALSTLLGQRIGRAWSQRLLIVGAGCLYAMPVLGMLGEITWGWQITLLLLSVIFGAWSFQLESRALLLVSTLSVLTDLAFFLLMLRRTEPMLLWVAGVIFGLGLMALAALLEKRREEVRQQIRLWSDELRSWA